MDEKKDYKTIMNIVHQLKTNMGVDFKSTTIPEKISLPSTVKVNGEEIKLADINAKVNQEHYKTNAGGIKPAAKEVKQEANEVQTAETKASVETTEEVLDTGEVPKENIKIEENEIPVKPSIQSASVPKATDQQKVQKHVEPEFDESGFCTNIPEVLLSYDGVESVSDTEFGIEVTTKDGKKEKFTSIEEAIGFITGNTPTFSLSNTKKSYTEQVTIEGNTKTTVRTASDGKATHVIDNDNDGVTDLEITYQPDGKEYHRVAYNNCKKSSEEFSYYDGDYSYHTKSNYGEDGRRISTSTTTSNSVNELKKSTTHYDVINNKVIGTVDYYRNGEVRITDGDTGEVKIVKEEDLASDN